VNGARFNSDLSRRKIQSGIGNEKYSSPVWKKKKLSSSLRTFSLSLKRKRRFLEEVLYEVPGSAQTLPPILFS